jgi:membrane protease subunit HflK
MGADITGVTVQSLAAPDQVAAAFEETVKAQEDRNRARSEAQAYADDIIPQAKGKAARQVQDAEGYRATAVNTATGNAARFNQVVAEYAKAPAVTRDRMYLDTMQQIFSSTSKVMVDAKTANTIYLPLDRLLNQSVANEQAMGSRSGPVMPQPQPQAQSQPQTQTQTQTQTSQQQAQPAPAQEVRPQTESVRRIDPRSRENGRERESR